jgi:hypothetical protein
MLNKFFNQNENMHHFVGLVLLHLLTFFISCHNLMIYSLIVEEI